MSTPQIEHFPKALIYKWLIMAVTAGSVNAGGYIACRRFVTHVTGFATLFGVDAANGDLAAALGMLSVPAFFLLGVMVGAFFTDAALVQGRSPHYSLVMSLSAALLLIVVLAGYLGAFGVFGDRFHLERDYLLLILLCAASGLQNAAITTASSSVMRATHLTGITTDLGIGLTRALFGHMPAERRRREFYRNWLRLGLIISFGFGAVLGALLFQAVQYLGFLLPFALSIYSGNLGARSVQKALEQSRSSSLPASSSASSSSSPPDLDGAAGQ